MQQYDIMVPVEVSGEKTVWHRIGFAFEAEGNKKHKMSMTIFSIPTGLQGPLKCFLYPREPKE